MTATPPTKSPHGVDATLPGVAVEATDPGPAWRRLSPRMLAVHPVQEIGRALPVLLAVVVASHRNHGPIWGALGAVLAVGYGILRWATTSYRVTPEQVQVRRGLVRRRVLSVPRDRVRTVDLTAHALHRVLGLTRLTIGTGQSDHKSDRGLRLDALSTDEAERLREELLHRPAAAAPVAATPSAAATMAGAGPAAVPAGVGEAGGTAARAGVSGETTLAELDPAWIRYGPFTLSGFVAIGVVVGFGWRLLNEAEVDIRRVGPLRAIGDYLTGLPVPVAVAEVLLTVVAVVAIASTVGYLLAFWKFRLVRRDGGTLHVTRGLLTARATTLEERRLRGVEISEPLLLRSVGGARCIAIATGLRVGHGAERGGSLLLPPAPRAEADRVAGAILGTTAPVTSPVVAHGRGARRRRYTRALAAAALVTAVLATVSWLAGWPAVVWQVSLVLWGLAALLAHDRYRSLGHAVTGHHLVIRTGSVVRRRYALSRDGVIGWNVHASFWQRRAGLVTLTATTAAGRQKYAVTDAPAATALAVADEITPGLLTPFLATR